MATPIELSGGYFKKGFSMSRIGMFGASVIGRQGIGANEVFGVESSFTSKSRISRAVREFNAIADRVSREFSKYPRDPESAKMILLSHLLFEKNQGFGFEADEKPRLISESLLVKRLSSTAVTLLTLMLARRFGFPLQLSLTPHGYFLRWRGPQVRFNFNSSIAFAESETVGLFKIREISLKGGAFLSDRDHEGKMAAVQYNCGMARLEENDPAGARECFAKAADLDKKLPWAHFELGRLSRLSGDLVEAEEQLTRALELDPAYVKALWERANIARLNGERDAMNVDLAGAFLYADPVHDHHVLTNDRNGTAKEKLSTLIGSRYPTDIYRFEPN